MRNMGLTIPVAVTKVSGKWRESASINVSRGITRGKRKRGQRKAE